MSGAQIINVLKLMAEYRSDEAAKGLEWIKTSEGTSALLHSKTDAEFLEKVRERFGKGKTKAIQTPGDISSPPRRKKRAAECLEDIHGTGLFGHGL